MIRLLAALMVAGMSCAACYAEKVKTKMEIGDIIGSSHVAGQYSFSDKDYLNEGADVLLEMGSRVIKLWLVTNPNVWYPFNSKWPKIESLVDLAKTSYFREVFAKPFTTYILEYPPGSLGGGQFAQGVSTEDQERQRLYEISKYLLTTYKGTGKTFIIQNWEGDWALTSAGSDKEPTEAAISEMITVLNARQDGVERARNEVGTDGVMVAHAAEVNLVAKAIDGKKCVTNDVLPYTHCDLYSYSAYDTSLKGPKEFRAALDYLAKKAPDSKLFGSNNIY
ncbi:MAG: hypothetical protein WCL39_14170, partial [Armatimonadota bacterium]